MWHLTPDERRANAKKAAETRKSRGEKPFGGKRGKRHMSPAERVAAAKKAAATRLARHER